MDMFDANIDFDGNCSSSSSQSKNLTKDEVDKDRPAPKPKYDPTSLDYDMSGDKLMVIFNHHTYQNTRYFDCLPRPRENTCHDVKRLQQSFGHVGFKIDKPCDNYTHADILNKLQNICKKDHSSTSCLAIAILTHGSRGGKVYAADKPYPLNDVINFILHAPSLAGKPKLFFIQACRGGNADAGHRVQFDGRAAVTIPTHSDCLVLMSTFDEYVSYRGSQGSWMIQTLCDVMDEHHEDRDLLHMVTLVNNHVAARLSTSKKLPEHHDKKQIPETRFTLTKFLKF